MTIRFKAILAAASFAAAVLSGCSAGSEPETVRYSLISGVSASSLSSPYKIKVSLFGDLKDGGLAVRTSDVTVRPAVHHVWSGGLDSQLEVLIAGAMHDAGKSHEPRPIISRGSTADPSKIDRNSQGSQGRRRSQQPRPDLPRRTTANSKILERCSMRNDRVSILPNHLSILPDRFSKLPDHSSILPDRFSQSL